VALCAVFGAAERPIRGFRAVQRHYSPDLLRYNRGDHQVSHAHQIVGRARERKRQVHLQGSAMTHLAQQNNGLQPAEAFFDTLPLLLADPIAHVPRRSAVDGTAASASQILRHVGRHLQVPALAHKIGGVETFVTAHGHATDSRNLLQHLQRRIAFGDARGFPYPARHDQPVAILHQQISAVAQFRLLAPALARQLGLGIAF
jgi:hypothetical protein